MIDTASRNTLPKGNIEKFCFESFKNLCLRYSSNISEVRSFLEYIVVLPLHFINDNNGIFIGKIGFARRYNTAKW